MDPSHTPPVIGDGSNGSAAGAVVSDPDDCQAPQPFTHPVDVEEWRRMGRQLVDFIAAYYEELMAHPERVPVQNARLRPGYLVAQLPRAPPEAPERFERLLEDVAELILPGLLHWQHPQFFGYFPATTSFAANLADTLSDALGTLGFQWQTSPAMTELEVVMLDWLVTLLGLPAHYLSTAGAGAGAAIEPSASDATLVSMLAAKARALHGRPPQESVRLVAYASDQAHSCAAKAGMVAGVVHFRTLPTLREDDYALQPEVLEAAVEADTAAGLLPFWACATIGTTSSCAVDPVGALAEVGRRHGVWLHVDAAYAGSFAALPEERRRHFGGVELADSYCFNPHKLLLTGYGCSALYVRQQRWVRASMAVTPEYLRQPGDTGSGHVAGARIDAGTDGGSNGGSSNGNGGTAGAFPPEFKDWEVALGTRFRAMKLWFVLRLYGAAKLRELMAHRLRLMRYFVALLRRDERFELVPGAPPRFGLVCFYPTHGGDAASAALLRAVNASGRAFLTHTRLGGRVVLRMAIGGTHTQACHVLAAWHAIQGAADANKDEDAVAAGPPL